MKIECRVSISSSEYTIHKKEVTVTLEGEFEAIIELLRKANFDLTKAQELELK